MMMATHFSPYRVRTLGLPVFVCLTFWTAAPAFAQFGSSLGPVDTPGLEIEAEIGIDGVIDDATPLPISFLIRNDSTQDIEGRLVLTEPWRGFEHVLGDIYIGAGSTRTFSSIQALPDWYACMASLEQDNKIHWRRELLMGTRDSGYQSDCQYALFVDPDGRQLRMSNDDADISAEAAASDKQIIDKDISVRVLNTLPWQVPKHPAALTGIDAVVFSEHAAESDLNLGQWRALACWISQGGTVFVPASSDKILNSLLESAPLSVSRANPSGGFVERETGLGRILIFDTPLFTRGTDEERRAIRLKILQSVAAIPDNQLAARIESAPSPYHRDSGTDHNRALVVALFIVYMILSGVVSLILFRLDRRHIVVYTVSVVLITACLAAAVGASIRLSQGNLRWVSVTEVGDQGAVQFGRITVHSVGGRSTNVGVLGDNADLQLLETQYRNWWDDAPVLHPAFTWQPNLNKAAESSYQIIAPVTPWGKRLLSAVGYAKDIPNLDVELDFEPATTDGQTTAQAEQAPEGTFVLKLINHLPYDLESASVVITVADRASDGYVWQVEQSMETIAPAGSQEIRFNAEFTIRNEWQDRNRRRTTPAPRRFTRTRPENVSAYVMGRIARSPVLTIDESHSDFAPAEELHYILRQIEADEMSRSVTEALTDGWQTAK